METVVEEFVVFLKNKESGSYIMGSHPCKGNSLEDVMARYSRYRDIWESVESGYDYNDFQIKHRTVITTDWELID